MKIFFERNIFIIYFLDTSNDNIPLKSNTETEYKINLRSEPEPTTTTTQQLVQPPYESGILIFTSRICRRNLTLRILLFDIIIRKHLLIICIV